MSTLATLNVVLNGDIGGFLKSMKQAESQSSSSSNMIQSALSGIGSVAKVAAAGAVAAIGAVTGAAVAGVAAYNNWADQLDSIGDVLGTTADESAGLAVAIRRVGGDTEAITGQMAKLAKGLTDASGKATPTAQLMTKLGIAFKDAKGQMLPATGILENVANKLAKMPDGLEKTAIMTQLFGKSGKDLSDTMNALANGGLAAAEEKAKALGLAIGDDGVNRSIEFGKSVEDLKMTLEGIAVSIGSVIMPMLQPLIQKFSEWAISVMPQVRAGIEAVFSWIQTNVGPILEGMVAMLQTAVAWIQANWPQIQSTIMTTWNNIRAAVEPVINAIAGVIKAVFGSISSFLQTHGAEIISFITTTWNTIIEIVGPIVQRLYDNFVTTFGGLATWINENQGEIQRIFQGVWDGIKMFVGTVLELIRGVVNVVLSLLKGDVQGALDAIKNMFVNIWEGIKGYVGQAVETMRMILAIVWFKIKEAVETAWTGIRTGIETAWNNILVFFATLPDKLKALGKQIMEGLWEGIKGMFKQIGDGISNWFNTTIAQIKKDLGIQSPSTIFAGMGENLMLGLAQGIARSAQLPRAQLAAAIDDLSGSVTLNAQADLTTLVRPAARNELAGEMSSRGTTIINNNYINDSLSARIILEQQRNDLLRTTKAAF